MKSTFLTIVVILLAIFNSFSQSSTVTIFTQEGEKIWVVVDGEKKNKDPQTKVIIDNLKAQNYKFKVVFQDSNIPSLDKTIYTKDVDNNFHNSSYVVRKDTKGSKYVIRVNSDEIVTTTTTTTTTTAPANTNTTTTTTTVPANTNNTSTTTTINSQPNGNQTQTQTYQQNLTTTTNTPDNINMNVGINVNETPDGVNMNVNMGGVNVTTSASGNNNGANTSANINAAGANSSHSTVTSSTSTTTTTTTTSSSNLSSNNQKPVATTIQNKPAEKPAQQTAYTMPGYSGPTGCPTPMSNESFTAAKASISSKSFEDSKLTIAKQVVGNNCLVCSQVKEIMKLFKFEDSKLDFAKFAYKHTFDIGNYYQLNDAFNFESTIEELNQYISNGGK